MKKTKERGITLIALIITIIVMLILVGVTVNVALSGGLFNKAREGIKGTDKARIEEQMTSVVLGFMNENLLADADIGELKQELSEIPGVTEVEGDSFPITVKDKNDNEWTIDVNGRIKEQEPQIEKVITEKDEEYSYWKTDGKGTIIYYEVPEGKEVPETLIVPCQIGDEKITAIGDFALCGVRIKRNESGVAVLEPNEDGEEDVVFLDEYDEDIDDIKPTGQTTKIKNIIISRGIETIGDIAIIYCTSLKEITFPGTIKEIDDTCRFYGCTELTVKISEGTTTICDNAFSGCENLLKTIILPSTLTEIGSQAFYNCTTLTNIELPDGLVTIGAQSFSNCTSIETIYIPASVDIMGSLAFSRWTQEQTIRMERKEEPASMLDHDYSKIGWAKEWTRYCDAKILWGQQR